MAKNNLTIPKGWQKLKLGENFSLSQGKYLTKDEMTQSGYPVYGANGIIGYSNNFMYSDPTVLVSCRGANCGVVHITKPNSWVSNNSIAVIPDSEKIDPVFLYYKLFFDGFDGFITGSAQPQIVVNVLGRKEVVIPTFSEQNKIAEILSIMDGEIQKIDNVISKTENLKRGILRDIFSRGINHKKFKKSKLGMIPEEWDVLSIQDLIDKNYLENNQDGNHGSQHPKSSDFTSDGIPFITAADLKGNKLDLTNGHFLSKELADKLRIGFSYKSDVLITHKGSIGATAILENLKTEYAMLSPQVTYYRCKKGFLNKFLFYTFQADYFQTNLKAVSRQSTRDFLSITNQRKLKIIFCPDIHEQTKIVEILESIDKKIDTAKSLKTHYLHLKQGLMSDLLSGKVRVINN